MTKDSVDIVLRTVNERDSYDPLFNVFLESNIVFTYSHLFGSKMKVHIDADDLPQVQSILSDAKMYKVMSITRHYKS